MEKIYRVKLNAKGAPNFATAEEVADRPQGEWIPCSERLPSGTDTVLVSTCAFNAIYDVVFMMAKDVERFYECGYVNAWMPSPEPWKGADDE